LQELDNGRAGRGEGWFWTGQLQLLGLRLKSCSYLTTTLGLFQKPCTSDYTITPDITVSRIPIPDKELNKNERLINASDTIANKTPLRETNSSSNKKILHASISCKWTMRSDRAQNTRTEALNIIRGRKGNTPHIVAVTFEPMPTRLASIAMGTGDVDCTYHGALYELLEAVRETGREDSLELIETLVEGRRLRDISDLPLDLAI
ncbi:MAG TPA: NgoMIV family type II restriction endonuclease, partial [Chloroflexia bacterium]|nr:NgoMIV family type II restriction endonuclease [Chloroflexia bacterium]